MMYSPRRPWRLYLPCLNGSVTLSFLRYAHPRGGRPTNVLEEVGVKVKDRLTYVHSTSFVTDTNHNVVDIVFLCEYESGDALPLCSDEVEEVLWLTTEEILHHPKAPVYLKESIKYAEALIPIH
ncbi:NUDIX hydrolase [Cytobacillus sp. FSL H8-0458]|uniref:NUDIX hydrolase n=1 Tax=Cytobacillus sp. FSL H8-0458 TaxID=2975346 RepID=UPI004046E2D7